jgi:hypothetical protein
MKQRLNLPPHTLFPLYDDSGNRVAFVVYRGEHKGLVAVGADRSNLAVAERRLTDAEVEAVLAGGEIELVQEPPPGALGWRKLNDRSAGGQSHFQMTTVEMLDKLFAPKQKAPLDVPAELKRGDIIDLRQVAPQPDGHDPVNQWVTDLGRVRVLRVDRDQAGNPTGADFEFLTTPNAMRRRH